MTEQQRKALVRGYLGKIVTVQIDRPIGYVHHKERYTLTYPINYGFLPGVLGGDGEELDVYVLGVNQPIDRFTGRVIGIVYREDDVEDKLIAASDGVAYDAADMARAVHFQEQHYRTRLEALTEK